MLNNAEFIDQIISELGQAVEATGMNKALILVKVGQMLITLQNGIKNDEKAHKEQVNSLQIQIDELVKQLNGEEVIERVVIPISEEMNSNGKSSS